LTETILSSKGQVVIPKGVRKALGLKPRQRLEIEVLSNGTMLVIPMPTDVVKAIRLPTAERLGHALAKERATEEERTESMVKRLRKGESISGHMGLDRKIQGKSRCREAL